MAFGSLSANVWVCDPVLLRDWCGVSVGYWTWQGFG